MANDERNAQLTFTAARAERITGTLQITDVDSAFTLSGGCQPHGSGGCESQTGKLLFGDSSLLNLLDRWLAEHGKSYAASQ